MCQNLIIRLTFIAAIALLLLRINTYNNNKVCIILRILSLAIDKIYR
ncbi:hypothetical protein FDUTEX481_03566 [Tolypothrix sp. PCC 7601]|nr:hypothetical protein FDUTEX481_03566 [Tolypothrix sp. PCC 7601]